MTIFGGICISGKSKSSKDWIYSLLIFTEEDNIVWMELSTFTDASEDTCAVLCFTQIVYSDDLVLIRQVKSANRLAPLKTISVCKLEQNAARMQSCLANLNLANWNHNGEGRYDARYFWTDSSIVRDRVWSVPTRYQVNVSHRIVDILMLKEPHECRFVPGKLNPEDDEQRRDLN
jgi:hypothetical protein